MNDVKQRRVLAFYKFTPVSDINSVQQQLFEIAEAGKVKGTILLADEGVNGTVVGEVGALGQLRDCLLQLFGEIAFKWSDVEERNQGFHRLKVKIKPEIVSFGVADLDVQQNGQHVSANEWNELIADPDVLVIDTRNTYEIDIGSFPQAISPQTTNFREFPSWVQQNLDPQEHKKVAMFCTGGIRCEKASAYMLKAGFDEVYQLDGGILNYLESVDDNANQWQGECFVFDQRVSVNAQLEQGQYKQCFACRHPLSQAELDSEEYEPGVRCPHCYNQVDEARAERFRQRQKQVKLAKARGEQHIGVTQKVKQKTPNAAK